LFCGTTFLSIYTVLHAKWHGGSLPGYNNVKTMQAQNNDPDKEAFSTAPHDEEAYAHVPMNDRDADRRGDADRRDDRRDDAYGGSASHGGYAGGSQSGYGDGGQERYGTGSSRRDNPFESRHDDPFESRHDNPFESRHDNPFESDAEYHAPSQTGGRYHPPAAQDDYEDHHGPAQFPAGNYDRVARSG
jgi:hypothetical protein